ncbi:MAG: DUF707 domain-containing protein [Bradyrhizobium sp.]|uniref:DUF707 domain-containing protein n=1 Tax=Bradyrhizobium sp. TaxID=376 RepID=UPI0011F95F1A|nr:DUF707 domain-containing protein [Bradyrhizobium sp.]THD65474.1 MAG: DUF707 domain-containing protein [Bradyrhizobium sp.]
MGLAARLVRPQPKFPDDLVDLANFGGITKFPSIKRLDATWPGYLQSYQAVWFVDGDVEIAFEDIDTLFDIFSRYDLWLAQPSLSPSSFHAHEICVHRPGVALRYVNFVEIMAPIFSRHGLKTCLATFDQSISGWGLDVVWPALLGQPQRRIAIIDAIQIEHPRKMDLVAGPFYLLLGSMGVDPRAEKKAVMEQYGVTQEFQTYEYVLK